MSGDTHSAHYIYGLFNRNGRCRYIGRTQRPDSRRHSHARKKLRFEIICSCTATAVHGLEFALIKEYQRQGGCDLNKAGRILPYGISSFLSQAGRKGGKAGTRADKVKAARTRWNKHKAGHAKTDTHTVKP